MFGFLDPISLIFLVVAVILIFRLRDVLGTKTGNEEKPFDPFSNPRKREDQKAPTPDDIGDNVITLPGHDTQEVNNTQEQERSIDKLAPEGSSLNAALKQMMALDKTFSVDSFTQGACAAYEMIVTAFAKGDRKTLKKLLAKDVYEGFSNALDERERNKQTVEFSFVGIDKASIIEAETARNEAEIVVRFISSIITCTKDDIGHVLDGDPNAIKEVTDIWTFSRDMTNRNPNWKLIGTETA